MASLSTRIAASLIVILIFAIGLTAVLNYYKVAESFSELARSRYSFLVLDMRDTLETAMNLGLPIRDLDNVPDLLAQQATLNSDILSIEIFDPDGTVMFGTDSSFIGDLVADEWLAAWQRSDDPVWTAPDDLGDTVGIPLHNSLGQVEGILALRYSRAPERAALAGLSVELAGWGLVIVVVSAFLAIVGVTLVLRPTRARLIDMNEAMKRMARSTDNDPDDPGSKNTSEGFVRFIRTSREADAELTLRAREVHRLDREG